MTSNSRMIICKGEFLPAQMDSFHERKTASILSPGGLWPDQINHPPNDKNPEIKPELFPLYEDQAGETMFKPIFSVMPERRRIPGYLPPVLKKYWRYGI
jgi:hypothetical protein